MKKLIILLVVILFIGCSQKTNEGQLPLTHRIIKIDGCQYIMANTIKGYNGYGYMAHKGNCDNCRRIK